MDFEWDHLKSDDCFIKREFDFEAVIDVYLYASIEFSSNNFCPKSER